MANGKELIPNVAAPTPQQAQLAAAAPQPQTQVQAPGAPIDTGLMSQWKQYLDRPDIRAGMLQFAVSVLQPVAPGQSTLGHIAQSVGSGAGAIGRAGETERTRGIEER